MIRLYAHKLMELSSFNKEWTEAFTSCIPYGDPYLTEKDFSRLANNFTRHHFKHTGDEWDAFVEDVFTFYNAINED